MSRRSTCRRPRAVADDVPALSEYLAPTHKQRLAADAYLREQNVPESQAGLLAQVVESLDRSEREYVAEARLQGDQARVWDTARRLLAMRLADAAVATDRKADTEET